MKVGVVREKAARRTPGGSGSRFGSGPDKGRSGGAGRSRSGLAAGFATNSTRPRARADAADAGRGFRRGRRIVQVRTLGANLEAGIGDLGLIARGQALIGFSEPLASTAAMQQWQPAGPAVLAMELIPRISRAQSMDTLSSMATIAGYKAVLLAAKLAKMFPMLITAAGTHVGRRKV